MASTGTSERSPTGSSRDLTVRFGDTVAVDARRPRRRRPGRWSRCSARRAAASPRCCARSPASRRPPPAPITYDGRDLAGTPTHKRGFALMFQDGQLFEHPTSPRNIAYPLRLRHREPRRPAGRGSRELLDAGRPRGVRRPDARHALRGRAPAGRPGPGAGRRAAAAAARRAAQRPRPRPARAAGRRAARHPARGRSHGDAGHPRPGGGVRGRRPDGGDARRADRPGRHPRGGVERGRPTPGPRAFLGYATVLDRRARRLVCASCVAPGRDLGRRWPCGARRCGSTRPGR